MNPYIIKLKEFIDGLPPEAAGNGWILSNGDHAIEGANIQVVVSSINNPLDFREAKGTFESDGFYFKDRFKLSFNWNIVAWRYV